MIESGAFAFARPWPLNQLCTFLATSPCSHMVPTTAELCSLIYRPKKGMSIWGGSLCLARLTQSASLSARHSSSLIKSGRSCRSSPGAFKPVLIGHESYPLTCRQGQRQWRVSAAGMRQTGRAGVVRRRESPPPRGGARTFIFNVWGFSSLMYGLICKDRGIQSPGRQAKESKLDLARSLERHSTGHLASHFSPSSRLFSPSIWGFANTPTPTPSKSCKADARKEV